MSGDMEARVYNLSEKLGVTQGQVNTIFSVLKDLKDSLSNMSGDLKSIRSDIHGLVAELNSVKSFEARIQKLSDKTRELEKWRNIQLGAIAILIPAIDYVIAIYVR
jgi:phage-related protein